MKDIDFVNWLIEKAMEEAAEEDDDEITADDEIIAAEDDIMETADDLFYVTEISPDWKLGFDMQKYAMWPDDETEEYVKKALGGGDIRYTQITVYNAKDAEIMAPAFELGVKIEDGKCVGVVPFLYEKRDMFSNITIDYRKKGELNRRWNEFCNGKAL